MSDELTGQQGESQEGGEEAVSRVSAPAVKREGFVKRLVNFIGADNLSLMFAIVVLVFLITVVSGWFGMDGATKEELCTYLSTECRIAA